MYFGEQHQHEVEKSFEAARDTFLTCLSQFRHTKGQLGNIHLALCVDKGLESSAACEVMELFERAVDADKSGDHVTLPQSWLDALRAKKKHLKWPHFMDKGPSSSSKDAGLLGQLYDQVNHIRICNTKRLQIAIQTSKLHPDRDLEVFFKTEDMQLEAKRARNLIENALCSTYQPLTAAVHTLRDDFLAGLDVELKDSVRHAHDTKLLNLVLCLESTEMFDTLPETVKAALVTRARIWYTTDFEVMVERAQVQPEESGDSHPRSLTQSQPHAAYDCGRLIYNTVGAALLLKAKQTTIT